MLRTAGRVLEISVAANTDTWMAVDRREELRSMPPSPRRYMSRVLLEFSLGAPRVAGAALDRIAGTQGYRYLGAGVEYSVYYDEKSKEAVKVHRDSANKPAEYMQSLVAEKHRDHKALCNYLGNIMLPQQVVLADHPLGDYKTLQVRQPFVKFLRDDAPFAVNSKQVDINRLDALLRRHPGLDGGLQDFVDRSRQMYECDGLLPDTNGANNVVGQPDGGVILLDSTPIDRTIPELQGLVLRQLDSLQNGLQAVS